MFLVRAKAAVEQGQARDGHQQHQHRMPVIIQAVSPLLGPEACGACANATRLRDKSSDAVIAVAAIRREVPTVMR
jgi:hypothetical protein